MSLNILGAFTLGNANIGAAAGVSAATPLLAQMDGILYGPFGLGSLQADIAAQLNGSLQSQAQLALTISNPLAAIQATLDGIASISASLTAALTLPLPSQSLLPSISASAAVSASLAARLGGIQGLISAALNVKLAGVDIIAGLAANLAAGPVVVASWGYSGPPTTLAQAGFDIQSAFSAGLGGILPGDTVYGVLLVTKQLSASTALAATIRVT